MVMRRLAAEKDHMYHRDFSYIVTAFLEKPPPIALLSIKCEVASRWHAARAGLLEQAAPFTLDVPRSHRLETLPPDALED